MRILLSTLLSLTFSVMILAQDAYHNNLTASLASDYNLPTGNWLIANTETDVYATVTNYGCIVSEQEVVGQDFTLASQAVVSQAGGNQWDSGWKTANTTSVTSGDKMLLVLWVRSVGGNGSAYVFAERTSNFVKEIYLPIDINEEWSQYYIPFEATGGSYTSGQLSIGFHLATEAQTLQIGGFTAINYGTSIALSDLPSDLNNEEYDGFELDAPWRAEAANRIDQLRKASLTINAEMTDGTPVPAAAFDIEMQQHEFAFGSAITASRIAGNNDQNILYENKISNLDGNGHGFNWVVFENDLKWDGWEEEWFVNHDELVNAVEWLHDRNISIRGHNLVWPGFQNMPDDIQANTGDPDYIWGRIEGRLDEILNYPGLEVSKIPEWDVLNEIVTNTSLEPVFQNVSGNVTGREVYADIFNKVKEISPETKLYINDYVTLSTNNTGGGQYDILKNKIQELVDAGAPVEGIGFQGHIGAFPNGIPSVLNTLDDFYNSFGLTAKITEFDLPPAVSEELGANYLRDFMTAIFSHESMDGFLFWNFWDGSTWLNPGANMFRENWSRTPAGDMFVDLVFNEWWTDTLLTTNTNGVLQTDVFKGEYTITYVCNGETITETRNITENETMTIVCDDLQTGIEDLKEQLSFSIYPNPVQNMLTIRRTDAQSAQVVLFNSLGAKVMEQSISGKVAEIMVKDLNSGVYFLELNTPQGRGFQKIIIE